MNRRRNQDPARLRRRRIEAGLSQTALAQKAGLTKQHVSMVERGKAGFSPRSLASIAAVLSCTIADLMPDEPDANTEPETPTELVTNAEAGAA